jgi:hypothetical protein
MELWHRWANNFRVEYQLYILLNYKYIEAFLAHINTPFRGSFVFVIVFSNTYQRINEMSICPHPYFSLGMDPHPYFIFPVEGRARPLGAQLPQALQVLAARSKRG